jgi:uncharacterized protein YndB with AHSA1/START domain
MLLSDHRTIAAPPTAVWAATVDIESWPAHTRTMSRIERLDGGPLRVGSTARVHQPGQRAKVWTVVRLVPEREFAWQTQAFGGTMTGSHLLEPAGDGATSHTLTLEVTGRRAGAIVRLLRPVLARALATENAGFAAAAAAHGAGHATAG